MTSLTQCSISSWLIGRCRVLELNVLQQGLIKAPQEVVNSVGQIKFRENFPNSQKFRGPAQSGR